MNEINRITTTLEKNSEIKFACDIIEVESPKAEINASVYNLEYAIRITIKMTSNIGKDFLIFSLTAFFLNKNSTLSSELNLWKSC